MEELLIQMQQTRQAQEAEVRRRRGIVRVAVILLVILILLRILGVAQGGVFPIQPVIAAERTDYATGPAAAMRVEWLNYCDQSRVGLAAYSATDIPCSPSRVVTLPNLQEQLVAANVLVKGESLSLAPASLAPSAACRVVAVNGDNGQITGWLCAEVNGNGLYRTDAAGQHPGLVWQFWSDDEWPLLQA